MNTYRKVIRYPLEAVDAGDENVNIVDGEGYIVIMENHDLSLEQWKFVVAALNKQADCGYFIPDA